MQGMLMRLLQMKKMKREWTITCVNEFYVHKYQNLCVWSCNIVTTPHFVAAECSSLQSQPLILCFYEYRIHHAPFGFCFLLSTSLCLQLNIIGPFLIVTMASAMCLLITLLRNFLLSLLSVPKMLPHVFTAGYYHCFLSIPHRSPLVCHVAPIHINIW